MTICPAEKCTGCGVCSLQCSHVTMREHASGFLYPEVDAAGCVSCGKCGRICPVAGATDWKNPAPRRYCRGHANDPELRARGTSGGAFGAIATAFVRAGGVAAGAALDEALRVRHVLVSDEEGIARLQKSKYVQSDCRDCYRAIREELAAGKRVLFSGTPCQVAGLYSHLGGKPENLYTCDLICAGIPSPGLFARYVSFLNERIGAPVEFAESRSKRFGWGSSVCAVTVGGRERICRTGSADASFFWGFRTGVTLRESCFNCKFTSESRVGDLTLGDFWVRPRNRRRYWSAEDRRIGESVILCNSEQGRRLLEDSRSELSILDISAELATEQQPHLRKPHIRPPDFARFQSDCGRLSYGELSMRYLQERPLRHLVRCLIPLWMERGIGRLREILR